MKHAATLIFALTLTIWNSVCVAEDCQLLSWRGPEPGTKTLIKGFYSSSFEHSGFTPCGKDRNYSWWLGSKDQTTGKRLQDELKKLGNSKYEPAKQRLYIEAEACLSEPGSYGHMGAYPHEVGIIKIVELHPETSEDCSE